MMSWQWKVCGACRVKIKLTSRRKSNKKKTNCLALRDLLTDSALTGETIPAEEKAYELRHRQGR